MSVAFRIGIADLLNTFKSYIYVVTQLFRRLFKIFNKYMVKSIPINQTREGKCQTLFNKNQPYHKEIRDKLNQCYVREDAMTWCCHQSYLLRKCLMLQPTMLHTSDEVGRMVMSGGTSTASTWNIGVVSLSICWNCSRFSSVNLDWAKNNIGLVAKV